MTNRWTPLFDSETLTDCETRLRHVEARQRAIREQIEALEVESYRLDEVESAIEDEARNECALIVADEVTLPASVQWTESRTYYCTACRSQNCEHAKAARSAAYLVLEGE